MTNNLKARPFSIVKKILGASLNHLLEEGNYSLQETRGKLSEMSVCADIPPLHLVLFILSIFFFHTIW